MIHWKGQMKYMSHIKGFISVLLTITPIFLFFFLTHKNIWILSCDTLSIIIYTTHNPGILKMTVLLTADILGKINAVDGQSLELLHFYTKCSTLPPSCVFI